MEARNHHITLCWKKGWQYKDIQAALLLKCGVDISIRQLQRVISGLGLRRKKRATNIDHVIDFVIEQLNTVGQLHGYRMMTQKCAQAGLYVSREIVRDIIKTLDPEGVQLRRRKRLIRRRYYGLGPNNNWHLDSYDKLKPYGFSINGCIDGYSRYMLWAEVSYTSNDPLVIAGYFIDAVLKHNGSPRTVRMDPGTENVHVATLQRFLQDDDADGTPVIIGSSTSNQRIECWWAQLRKENSEYFMMLFQGLQANGVFCGDGVDKDLLRLCFMNVVQVKLSSSPYYRPMCTFANPKLFTSHALISV